MLGNKVKYIIGIICILILNSCNDKNGGKFIFYSDGSAITIEQFEIYERKLNNLYLVIKNYQQRSLVINSKIDSMFYINENGKFKACRIKTTKDKYCDFNFEITNDGKKLFTSGTNSYKEELLFIGFKENLQFITANNPIILIETK
ncbi:MULTISPECIES: hypothetical protein [unclassified Flavobacterium]|uniref:hypothetical protein n=1 Tax=unclassified Flavobacterium TaxID=196869 RepID=UPI000958EE14|nr:MULTISPECIES: hypothetical protein [unclassified Flavobacterium]MBN9284405.1 hypothetical protein [Flavobacterium sp.]OJV72709.1 MAG: hypothetical protein BGO42_14850 [Flavobacterium sp. 40-81]